MSDMEPKAHPHPYDVTQLAQRFVARFPGLDAERRKLAIAIYRLLAKGEAVGYGELAGATGLPEGHLREVVGQWPGVFHEGERIIGFWGLTSAAASKHRFEVEGRQLYTWCAWDTLFIPKILAKSARVETPDPLTGEPVRLTVGPEGVEGLQPAGAVMSMLAPPEDLLEDIVGKLCHYIYFFSSRESGQRWTAQNPGTFLMSVAEGFELGRLKNLGRFGAALDENQP